MQSPNPQEIVWLVSFADDDDRELTAEEIGTALASGEIVLTTIVWRDGMPDWKPIVEVPELRGVVQKQRIVRPRSTVMGGFGSPAAPPPPQLSPRPPVAAAPPAPLPRSLAPTPFGQKPEGSPRGSLAGGLGAPRPSAPRPSDDEDAPATRRRVNPQSAGEENRTTLTGPGGPEPAADLDSDSDAEPISLAPESIVPDSLESLDSEELQSLLEQAPPEAPEPQIFDLRRGTPTVNVPGGTPTPAAPGAGPSRAPTPSPPRAAAPPAADVASWDDEEEASPPSIPLVTNASSRGPSRGPSVPLPPRKVHAPLPQAADPLADLDETSAPQKKGGGFGKLLLAALVLAGIGGAFYLGQKSAGEAAVVTVQASPVVTVVASAPVPDPIASAEPSATTEEDAPEPTESAEPSSDESEAPAARAASPARAAAPSRDDRNVELSRERAVADVPAEAPKPAPAPKPEPEEEDVASGPFDKDAAAAALASAASAAGSCRSSGDPSGVAQVSVTFSPTGRATRAIVDGPPFAGTATGGCIASKMTQAKVPAFTGSRVTVKKKVVIQ